MIDVFDTLHIILKLLISLISIVGMLRLMGNKEMKQNTPLQYCLLVILGGVVSIIATGSKYNSIELLLVTVAWFIMIYILETLKARYEFFRHLIQGKPRVVINEGIILHEELAKERMSEEELRMELREIGIFDFTEVKLAVIEVDGNITASKKESVKTVKENDLENKNV